MHVVVVVEPFHWLFFLCFTVWVAGYIFGYLTLFCESLHFVLVSQSGIGVLVSSKLLFVCNCGCLVLLINQF